MSIDILAWTKAWAIRQDVRVWSADETGSTNSIAKDDLQEATKPMGSRPSLYITRSQTSGRGRGDHTWTTPEGSSLLSSWSFSISQVPQPIFSALVGLAAYEAAIAVWPTVAFNMKAPNDLFIGDKKVAGILIETVDQGSAKRTVIGLGLNVTANPQGLTTATCLVDEGCDVNPTTWAQFLSNLEGRFTEATSDGQDDSLDEDVCERLKVALNRHPLLKEPILKVDELGQLHSASRIVRWHEL